MRGFIEELYYGNIDAQELSPEYGKTLRRMQNRLSETEEKLRGMLTSDEDKIFTEYVNLFYEFLCLSIADGFLTGFRTGAGFTLDTFVNGSKKSEQPIAKNP